MLGVKWIVHEPYGRFRRLDPPGNIRIYISHCKLARHTEEKHQTKVIGSMKQNLWKCWKTYLVLSMPWSRRWVCRACQMLDFGVVGQRPFGASQPACGRPYHRQMLNFGVVGQRPFRASQPVYGRPYHQSPPCYCRSVHLSYLASGKNKQFINK